MRTKIKSILFVAGTVIFCNATGLQANAQDRVTFLSLDEAISATLNNNRAIRLATLDENIAAINYKQTQAIYLPQVGFSYTALNTNNPLDAFGFKLQQKSVNQNDFNPGLLNYPSATSDFTTKLEIQQPLLNADGFYKRKAAAKLIELSRYKTDRIKEYLTFEVKKSYLQLQLAYDAADVYEEALKTTKSVYVFTDNHFKQGLIQKSDLLNAQVQVITVERNLAKAKDNIKNASDYLSLLMGVEADIVYKTERISLVEYTGGDMVSKIPASRSDLLAMQKTIEVTGLLIKANKKSYLPRVNAFGSYQLNDNRMLGFGADGYLAGVQLTWDLFKGNRTKNAIAVQTLERNKLIEELAQQKNQGQLEINKAYRDLGDAQHDMIQQKLAIEQASESLLILQNRYQQGLVNTTDVLQATTLLSQQRFALAQAVFTSNLTQAYLHFLTYSADK